MKQRNLIFKVFPISIFCLFFFNSLVAEKKDWKLSIVAFVNHNDKFADPTPITIQNLNQCFDCTGFQSYPTWGFGFGSLVKKEFKDGFEIQTGIVFSKYNFIERQSKEIAALYIQYFPSIAIEMKNSYMLLEIPLKMGLNIKKFKVQFGVNLSPCYFETYRSVSYYGNVINDINNRLTSKFYSIPELGFGYSISKSIYIYSGCEFRFRQFNFLKLGLEFQNLKKART